MKLNICVMAVCAALAFGTSAKAFNVIRPGNHQFCTLAGSMGERIQARRQQGYRPQQVANEQAQIIGESFSDNTGKSNLSGSERQRMATDLGQLAKALIQDAYAVRLMPSTQAKILASVAYGNFVYQYCMDS